MIVQVQPFCRLKQVQALLQEDTKVDKMAQGFRYTNAVEKNNNYHFWWMKGA